MAKKQKQEPDFKEVISRLNKIEKKLDKELKFKRRAQKALLNGIVGSFGATFIFAIIIAILAIIINKSESIPVLNGIIERTNLEQVVNKYNTFENEDVEGVSTEKDSNDNYNR